jgi:ATP-dependent DNA ligase
MISPIVNCQQFILSDFRGSIGRYRLGPKWTSRTFRARLRGLLRICRQAGYTGRCGSGFTDNLAIELLRKLRPLEVVKMPLPDFPNEGGRFGKNLRPADIH